MIAGVKIPQLKYRQVEIEIRQLAKTLPAGAKIPSERDLAVTYNCNFLTVRKALKHLVEDGTVVRRVGSGTFVSGQAVDLPYARRRNQQVGILLYHQGNAYAYRVVQSIAHAGLEQSVELRSSWVRGFTNDAVEQAAALKKGGCVALTLPWFPHDKVEEVRSFVQRCPLPVSMALVIPGLERNCFEVEHLFGAGASAVSVDLCRYYQLLGHRRIAFIGPDSPNDVILQKKLSSYACHVSRENLPSLCGLILPGAAAADQLVERWREYRGELAVISYDDEHALRFMTAMHKIGLSAPDDYAIVGYNDTEASHFCDPPLSTIRQNFDYIGRGLLASALALSEGELRQSSQPARMQLVVRSTCGGRAKIDAAFRAAIPDLDIIFDKDEAVVAPRAPVAEDAPSA